MSEAVFAALSQAWKDLIRQDGMARWWYHVVYNDRYEDEKPSGRILAEDYDPVCGVEIFLVCSFQARAA